MTTTTGSEKRYAALLEAARSGRLNRRTVLKRGLALGLSAPVIASLLAACGGGGSDSDSSTDTNSSSSGGTGGGTPTGSGTSEAGGQGGGGGQRGGGGTLRILLWQAPTILNPHLGQGTKDDEAARIALEPLAEFTTDGKMILVLAAEEPTLDNGMVAKDGKSVTWKLKQGVKWHDGQPFTSKDVKFTYDYVIDKATTATTQGVYQTVDTIETPDDYTVKITFKQPEPAWHKPFTGVSGVIIPQHLMQDYVGDKARNAPFNLRPIGTGPYKVVDFKPGDVTTYEINQDYREAGKPFFDRVEAKGGGDATSAARAVMQTGEADWAWNLQIEAQVLKALESGGQGKLVTWEGGGTERLMPNFSDPNTEKDGQKSNKNVPHPHLSKLKVRQALTAACRRDVIAETLYGAGGDPAVSTIDIPTSVVPQDIQWEYDLDKANGLLDEVGAQRGGDGIRTLSGRPMKWLYQTSVNPVRQKTQEIIKDSLKELGIDTTLKSIDSSVFFSGDAGNPDTDSHFYADLEMYTNVPANIFPIDWYRRYLSTEIAQKENSWAGRNYLRYQNPDFDALFNQVATELDPKKSTDLFLQMQHLIFDDVAEIALVARKNVSAASSKLTGYVPSSWRVETADIANWRME